jgi:hypothetical protein
MHVTEPLPLLAEQVSSNQEQTCGSEMTAGRWMAPFWRRNRRLRFLLARPVIRRWVFLPAHQQDYPDDYQHHDHSYDSCCPQAVMPFAHFNTSEQI